MVEKLPAGRGRLVCDECGLVGPRWSSPEKAVSLGLRCGWEVVHNYCLCPPCSEAGAQWGVDAAQEAVVTLVEPGEPSGTALIVEG